MRQSLIIIFIFSFMAAQSQGNTFDSVLNTLQFHIFTDKPDTCILPFLKRCIPVLAEKPEPAKGGWTTYPPGPIPTPKDGLLSIKLASHPSLQSKHSGARFDILTQEWEDGRAGIRALRVWFYFDRKTDADIALKTLVKMFKFTNTKASVMRHSAVQTIILHETGKDTGQSAKLSLQRNNEAEPKYSILFSYGFDDGKPW